MYEYDSRVRLSEVDREQHMTLYAILNHFQDCSVFHSEDRGVGMDYLAERNRMWVLASWKIVVRRCPKLGERIRVGTWPYEFGKMTGYRNFCLLDAQGEMAACADTSWVIMDTKRMRPTRLEGEISSAYELEPRLDMGADAEEGHLALPPEARAEEPFTVHVAHLDVNRHVNNVQYVQMAYEYLPEDFPVRQMRAEYKKSAVLNDVIYPRVGRSGDSYTIALGDGDGKPYAVIEFK